MTIRLYFDEDSMSRSLVRSLRARGIDVTTAFDEGMIEMEDSEHLEFSTQLNRVLCSHNVGDFHELHTIFLNEGKIHAGIILAPQQRYSIGEQMRRLLRLIATKSAEDMKNNLELLSMWGSL